VGRRRGARHTRQPRLDPAARRPRNLALRILLAGEVGTASKLASALRGWHLLRFEVTAEPCPTAEGERYSCTPELGIFHAVTGIHGDILIPEDRLRAALTRSQQGETNLEADIAKLLGKPWDDELEPFRYAGEGAPVRWLHQVV
jgi:hypothetical protein